MVAHEYLGGLLWLTVNVAGWSGALPGQFALLHPDISGCFLPRAFSVAAQAGDEISFLIAPIGAGTRELEGLEVGDLLWVTGPLGNGFDLRTLVAAPSPRIVIVAGGVGAAPFPLLLGRLAELRTDPRSRSLCFSASEARPKRRARDRSQRRRHSSPPPAVHAGSRSLLRMDSNGPARLVTDLLAVEARPGDRVVVCGPAAMSKAVWQVCREVPDVSGLVQHGDHAWPAAWARATVAPSPWPMVPSPGLSRRPCVQRPGYLRKNGTVSDMPEPSHNSHDLTVRLGPLTLAHPIINASGTMELFELADVFGDEMVNAPPVAAYVPKTITLEPRAGNPPPRILETPAGMINAIGLSGEGLAAFVRERLPRLLALPCPTILSIGGFALADYVIWPGDYGWRSKQASARAGSAGPASN